MINITSRDFDSGPWTTPQQKPPADPAPKVTEHVCPYCQQERPTDSSKSVHRVLTKSVHQFVFGIVLFAFGLVRVVRLAVASGFCLVGFIGGGFHSEA